jgi:hypothetical protein
MEPVKLTDLEVLKLYPVGSLVAFRGDEWLETLGDCIGIIVAHDWKSMLGYVLVVLVNGHTIDIMADEFDTRELELV